MLMYGKGANGGWNTNEVVLILMGGRTDNYSNVDIVPCVTASLTVCVFSSCRSFNRVAVCITLSESAPTELFNSPGL